MRVVIPETEKVLIFKGGIVVILKKFLLSSKGTFLYIEKPNYALKGSFWINTDRKRIIKSLELCEYQEPAVTVQKDAATIREQLMANIGENVTIVCGTRDKPTVMVGVITRVHTTTYVLKNEKSGMMLSIDEVLSVESEVLKEKYDETEEKEKKERIKITYDAQGKDEVAWMSYWRKDMTWIPSYKLHLDPKSLRGKLSLQSCIMNDGEDLKEIKDLTFLGGNPKISFPNDPELFVNSVIPNTASVPSRVRRRRYSISMNTNPMMNRIIDNRANTNEFVPTQVNSDDDGGDDKGDGDTCFYEVESGMTSMKGSKVIVPIFDCDLGYTEAYIVDLEGAANPKIVNHIIQVKNVTGHPLTAATVVVTSENEFMFSQAKLNFTGRGRIAEIETMVSLSIKVNYNEKVNRTKEVKSLLKGYSTHEVEMEGSVHIENRDKSKAKALLLVKHSFEGNFVSCKIKPEVETNLIDRYDQPNLTRTNLKWHITLKKGETKKYSFIYKKLVNKRKRF